MYHFVLTYSNWETGTICYSESLESLSEGWQNAVWELGAVAAEHRTDSLSSAVNNMSNLEEFNRRYEGVMRYYGVKPQHTNPASPNENGDVEQSHHRFKRAVEQALLLRGSRDFAEHGRVRAVSQGRCSRSGMRAGGQRLAEEMAVMRELPARRMESAKRERVKVDSGSLIHVERNSYSVNSRLIGAAGGSAVVPGPCRGLVRAEEGRRPAAVARAEQASRRLPAHHRMAGAEAGRV